MRYALSGEAGLNDGAAFPFVVLAILLVQNDGNLGAWVGTWALERVLWAVPAGLLIGYGMGWAFGRAVIAVRRRTGSQAAANDLFALALIALSYVGAESVHAWGFLATFAAGLGLRRAEVNIVKRAEDIPQLAPPITDDPHTPAETLLEPALNNDLEKHPVVASGALVRDVLTFGETLERSLSVVVVILVGALVSAAWDWRGVVVALLVFVVVRPVAAWLGLLGTQTTTEQRLLVAWFGLRGIGTLYYLAYAVGEGIGRTRAGEVWSIALTVVACSVVAHGISVTPLLRRYERGLEGENTSSGDAKTTQVPAGS
jgi:NhaP-type Na+/H+ or K+/H+ antiporter